MPHHKLPRSASTPHTASNARGPSPATVQRPIGISRETTVVRIDRLEESKYHRVQPISSAAFSVTMNGTEARLFVSWKEDNEYSMAKVESFLPQSPDHYLKFRKIIRNILDWGKSSRLSEIRGVLDALFGRDGGNREVQRKVRFRKPLSDDSPVGRRKRPRFGQ
ncbi:hypothetical protein I7I48_04833 [Histoplasma ohiense]|nr:hypothetical protein I7I48_04833 [Histoplasma ohiense (nom. inval.)]